MRTAAVVFVVALVWPCGGDLPGVWFESCLGGDGGPRDVRGLSLSRSPYKAAVLLPGFPLRDEAFRASAGAPRGLWWRFCAVGTISRGGSGANSGQAPSTRLGLWCCGGPPDAASAGAASPQGLAGPPRDGLQSISAGPALFRIGGPPNVAAPTGREGQTRTPQSPQIPLIFICP